MPSARPYALLAVAAAVSACGAGPPQSAYVELLGADTMSIEVFTRTADRIEGRLITRDRATRVAHYVAALSPTGAIERLEVDYTTPPENPEGPPPQRLVVTLDGDTARVERIRAETDTLAVAVQENTIPVVAKTPIPIAFIEHVVGRAIAAGTDEFPFGILAAGGRRVARNAVTRHSADTVTLDFFGRPIYVAVDEVGAVHGLSGRATTRQVEIRPADARALDLDALAADFAARDARGEGIGVASPADTVIASAAGADFELYYSRPAKRGRTIWGGLVPLDTIWRTGANAATVFVTSRALVMGDGTRVPAGSYSLWTTFSRDAGTLIVNEQTGQWGTAYDEARDFARVPMTPTSLSEPVERFTMIVEPADGGAVLKMAWDRTEFSVPMRVVR